VGGKVAFKLLVLLVRVALGVAEKALHLQALEEQGLLDKVITAAQVQVVLNMVLAEAEVLGL
jgi:hypothetical protein